MGQKTSELICGQSREYYRQNTFAKNRQDSARRLLDREGLFAFHDDLRGRIASGEVSVDTVADRYLRSRG